MDTNKTGTTGTTSSEQTNDQLHFVVVDDSSVERLILTTQLKKLKSRVTAFESGKAALEFLDSEPNVDMIVTDYSMPEMTGYELLKKVKESSKLPQIPVVIVSSDDVDTRITRCLEEGAEEFLLKPVKQSDVTRLCDLVNERKQRTAIETAASKQMS